MQTATSLETACVHCGTLFVPGTSSSFCCSGCEFVYALIQCKNLGTYYKILKENPPICPIPAQLSTATYDFCDAMEGPKIRFYLEGLNCTACLWLLEKLPQFCADAASVHVNMADSTIEVKRTPTGSFSAIARSLNRLGYRPHLLRENESTLSLQRRERRLDLIRLGIAGAATGNIMILAVSLYAGATGSLAQDFRWLSALIALPVMTYCAWPFYRSAFSSLRSFHLNLDVPICAALVAGIVTSFWGILSGTETVYFDSLSMLVFLLLGSRFFLKGVQSRLFNSTNLADELLLNNVTRVKADGHTENVCSLELNIDDVIRLDHEQVVPVDGHVISGHGAINAAVLTGESEPIAIGPGSLIEAGCRHVFGQWTLQVERTPSQTRLAQILRDTERSAQRKSHFLHFADRVSAWFIGIVLLIAGILFVRHEVSEAMALIIVTCPCVFGMAIPLSMSFAIRAAARKGVVIKNNDAIEKLWRVKNLFFDKTGTLTTGEMSVLDFSSESNEYLEIAYGLEKDQPHPVARAIVKHLRSLQIKEAQVPDVELLPDGGVRGRIHGSFYSLKPIANQSKHTPATKIYASYGLFQESKQVATFLLGDSLRAESKSILNWARRHHLTPHLISGDREQVVNNCAKDLGFEPLEVSAQATPELKSHTIQKYHGTAMIGDGANDAAALAAADVGIAVCGSLDVSLRAADVYLTRPHLGAIADLFQIAQLSRAAIYRNLLFSASFNLVSGSLAISGLMTPLWAAVLMPMSSFTVLMSAVWTEKKLLRTREIA